MTTTRRLKPPARRLAHDLPAESKRLSALLEPAKTAQTQLKTALGELREMNGLVAADPHYLPALIAVGRAYTALTGQDPLTGTAISPDFHGLEQELAAGVAELGGSTGDAASLPPGVKRLAGQLAHARRRSRVLERQLRRVERARQARIEAG